METSKIYNGTGKDLHFYLSWDCTWDHISSRLTLRLPDISPYLTLNSEKRLNAILQDTWIESVKGTPIPTKELIPIGVSQMPSELDWDVIISNSDYATAIKKLNPKKTIHIPTGPVYLRGNLIGYIGILKL